MKANITQCECGNVKNKGDWFTFNQWCNKCGRQIRSINKHFTMENPENIPDICEECEAK